MAFFESPRFPESIAFGAVGGPAFSTAVVKGISGKEQRNGNWTYPLHDWDVSQGVKNAADFAALRAFFMVARGRLNGWRFKDWADFTCASTEGAVSASGGPTGQLVKRYTSGGQYLDRIIAKPVAGTVALANGGSALTSPTHYTLDTTTGIVTWVAVASSSVTGVSVGATTAVTLTSALSGVAPGDKLYLTGLTGADAALLNGQAFVISGVAGAVYTLPVITTGKTITAAGSGISYPGGKATDSLTWSGQFDVPMRFDVDQINATIRDRASDGLLHMWDSIKIVELRNP